MNRTLRVCVVGAGVAGLTAVKALRERGIAVRCFERGDRLGGLWAFGNEGGNGTAYHSLRMNTSRARSALRDLPMDGDPRGFAGHEEVQAYLERYATQYGLREHIALGTAVESATAAADGGWIVAAGGAVEHFDGLVAASGHHWYPRPPEPPPPGAFGGRALHASDYVDAAGFEGADVVVVGLGNSAMDIAVEVSGVARRTILAWRGGVHVLPRRVAGRPLDQLELPLRSLLPSAVAGPAVGLLLRAILARPGMRPQDHGLPAPRHRLGACHPTVSDEIYARIDAGAIEPCGTIASLDADGVTFSDGRSAHADIVIFCTGYRATIPYLDARAAPPGEDVAPLFGHVLAPGVSGLWLAGFVQPIGPTLPVCELQARWIAAHAAGAYAPPSAPAMRAEIERAAQRRRRFAPTARHSLEVDFWAYTGWLRREMTRGARRAGRAAA